MRQRLELYFCMVLACFTRAWAQQMQMELARHHLRCQMVQQVCERPSYGIYQSGDCDGYVILANNAEGHGKLLAYVPHGQWNWDAQPPWVQHWLQRLDEYDTLNFCVDSVKPTRPSVFPLLTAHWHQKSPYNRLCPIIEDGNVKTVAGCVAIAASQVVYYWRDYLPEATLKDTPTYPYGIAPVTLSIPKGSPNNWDLILDKYDKMSPEESCNAVAQLVYVVGTTACLHYGSSTGGSTNNAATAIYLQFRLTSKTASRDQCTQEEWEALVYNDLAAGHPIIYSGTEPENSSGHAVVLDGYDGETDLYHFNFGWGGDGDGYYTIDSLGMAGYSEGQDCVYDIHPESFDGIEDQECALLSSASPVFDLMGRRRAGLVPGLNIVDCRKVFCKP